MPQSIPFDPSLVLGNIVHPDKITALEAVDKAQEPINVAQEKLNSLILSKRSLDMTVQEMIQMQVSDKDMKKLLAQVEKTKTAMAQAAVDYAGETVSAQAAIQTAKAKSAAIINYEVESPIDWNKSALMKMDLSSDTMVMDAQYFRYESEKAATNSHASSIASYVSGQVSSIFGPTVAASAAGSAHNAAISNASNHEIQGTLVITANCTHKMANMFAPFILDPEKGIRAWNVNKSSERIDTTSVGINKALKDDKTTMHLLSGQTQGSSFVGMVHLLKSEKANSSQSSSSATAEMNASIEENCWLASSQGKFGVDSSFSDSIKEMLSTSNVQAHASVITMGLIPSIKANQVATTVATLKPDPKDVMSDLSAIQGASNDEVTTTASAAEKAKTGQSFMQIKNDFISNAVSALTKADTASNKVIDTNSLMTAFESYVNKASSGEAGIPINFFLKPITPKQLASAYLAKFSPKKYWQYSSGDDEAKAGGN